MSDAKPVFRSVYLFVQDMGAALRFYRRLGLAIPEGAEHAPNVDVDLGSGAGISFGTVRLTKAYDTGWRDPAGGSPNSLQFSLPTRNAVDEIYADLTSAGYRGHQAPFDAFWGSRYAIVDDPDGNIVGFQSPQDEQKKGPPPAEAM